MLNRLRHGTCATIFLFGFFTLGGEAHAQPVATPTFSVPTGATSVQFYTGLTDTTPGATIYYTFTPTGATPVTPTTSSPSVTSGGTVLISQSGTVEAMAVESGYTNSTVASAAYQVTGQVAAGWYHTVALRTDGSVWTWGLNGSGQLGVSSETQHDSAVKVATLSGIIAVAAGAYHSVALDSGGHVWTWGMNGNGQLGDNTTTQRTSPVEVLKSNGSGGTTPLTNIVSICAGAYHNLALDSSGNVWAWGLNSSGQLGDTSTTQRNMAEELTTLSGVSVLQLAAGSYHSLLLTTTGTVYAWGLNSGGEVGDGTTTERHSPVAISGSGSALYGVIISAVSGGYEQSAALESDGTVWVWGDSYYGELGDGTTTVHKSPEHLSSLTGMVAVEAGVDFTIAIKSDGTVWAWGYNSCGEVGNGTSIQSDSPVQATGISGAVGLAAGTEDSLVLKNDGTVWVFGSNVNGELGNGASSVFPNAIQVLGLGTSISLIRTGNSASHILALDSSDNVWAWGDNQNGDLGDGTTYQRSAPVQVAFSGLGSATIESLAANGNRSMALDSNATVWSWGENRIGDGTTNDANQPVHLSGLTGITAMAEGNNYSLTLNSTGNVWSWGANASGQLGNNTLSNSSTPVEVKNYSGGSGTYLSGINAIGAGTSESLASSSSSTYAWGLNANGELGDGTTTNSSLPVSVGGLLSGVSANQVSGGLDFSAALWNGNVFTSGDNDGGQLGIGNTTQQLSPVEVINSDSSDLSNLVAVGCGNKSSINALKNDGTVWGWGGNSKGQLADGTTTQRLNPVQAINLSGVVAISTGNQFSVALKEDGSVESWGYNPEGGLGVEPNYSIGFPIPGFTTNATLPTPTVAITLPSNNATVTMAQTQTFTASASETGGTIASVSYYINSTLVGTATNSGSNYSVSWTPPTYGNFTFTAIATDTNGRTSYFSSPVTVQVPFDSDNNGLPDWWEVKYHIYGLGYTASSSPDGNGFTLWQDFQAGADPTNYYSQPNPNGHGAILITPTLTIISGNNQLSLASGFAPTPLVVQVTNSATGAVLYNAPVLFTVNNGAGMLNTSGTSTPTPTGFLQVRSDPNSSDPGYGYAQVYFEQPPAQNFTSSIGVSTGTAAATFTATTFGPPAPPSGLTVTSGQIAELDVHWTNNGSTATSLLVQQSTDLGTTWTTIATLSDPTVTTYAATGLTLGTKYLFQVIAVNPYGSSTP